MCRAVLLQLAAIAEVDKAQVLKHKAGSNFFSFIILISVTRGSAIISKGEWFVNYYITCCSLITKLQHSNVNLCFISAQTNNRNSTKS